MGKTLEVFFTGKSFKIPNYQRDYAWNTSHVDDMIDDIIEAIETNTSHYIGTFILAKTKDRDVFHVVDGQQRLTTLTMLFSEAIRKLGARRDKIIYKDKFIKFETDEGTAWRLELLNSNSDFFKKMLDGKRPKRETQSQKLMWQAYERIKERIANLKSSPDLANTFLDTMRTLEVMEFTESDDGKAIRIFQTVNDRGKPLSNMEKAKSLLIYYSNKFLDGSLDDYINDQFGKVFHLYTSCKTIGEDMGIEVIKSKRFNEDSVMRYHFLAFADSLYDYRATESYVLDVFLKKTLKPLRAKQAELKKFIENYVDDLTVFFESFLRILKRVSRKPKYYKLFINLGLSAFLYPLLIRLETRGLTEKKLETISNLTMLKLIEIADVRVYKIRGTDPRADVSYLARDAKTISQKDIEQRLIEFIQRFMGDAEFSRRLNADIYPNNALRHIFVEYDEFRTKKKLSVKSLRKLSDTTPTVEHIFPVEPRFDFPDFGFASPETYRDHIHTLGNLTMLEKGLNSQCRNKNPDEKIDANLYGRSLFSGPRRISALVQNRGNAYEQSDIQNRTQELANFCMKRWKL